MKKNIIYLLTVAMIGFVGCSPDSYDEGSLPNKSTLSFDISLSSSNSNTVVYKSENSGASVYWTWNNETESAEGNSTESSSQVHFGFPGKYTFKYFLMSKAGMVEADPKTIEITNYDLDYMDNPLWINLTGGVGKEKTWYLDLDASGKSVYWSGPLFFYGVDDSWESVTNGVTIDGDSWNWCPDWASNQWLMSAADFGSMTFGAIVGHTVSVDKKVEGVVNQGAYMIDVDAHTMTFTNATMLRDAARIPIVTNWTKVKILSLTDDAMQLGVIRDNDSSEGTAQLVYNYVSKDYYDAHK